jgi:HEPN domain-containing protein
MMADDRLTKLGALMIDLDQASRERLDDAEILLRGGRYAASITYAIYALEIKLKVLICRRLDLEQLPKLFEIHDLSALLLHTGLETKMKNVKRPRNLLENWERILGIAKIMDQVRYKPNPDQWDLSLAEQVLRLLRDPPDGVLLWVTRQASRKTP